jgi:uncharacterized membrane protein
MANVTNITTERKPVGLSIFFIVASLIGLIAAFALSYEKFFHLMHPNTHPSCDFSIVVQCGKNLDSWQGSLFGFPNPFLGLMGWPVVITIGVALLAGATFARWFWRAFGIVAILAFIFVIWLFAESVFSLGTLCPWCMVTWVATISLTVVFKGWSLKNGVWGDSPWLRTTGTRVLSWSPTIILAILLIEAFIAQLRLDWIHYL